MMDGLMTESNAQSEESSPLYGGDVEDYVISVASAIDGDRRTLQAWRSQLIMVVAKSYATDSKPCSFEVKRCHFRS
jgi:hypothetical protein